MLSTDNAQQIPLWSYNLSKFCKKAHIKRITTYGKKNIDVKHLKFPENEKQRSFKEFKIKKLNRIIKQQNRSDFEL